MIDVNNMMPEDVLAAYNKVKEMARYQKKYSETYVASLINLEKVCHIHKLSFTKVLKSIEDAPCEREYRYWKTKFYGDPLLRRPKSRELWVRSDEQIPDANASWTKNPDGSWDIEWSDAFTKQTWPVHIPAEAVTFAMPLPPVVEKTSVELCAGAGANTLGAEQAGFKTTAAVDPDQNSMDVFRANFTDVLTFQMTVEELMKEENEEDFAKIPRPQHMGLGVPCQDFSGANFGASWDGPLNVIAFQCLEMVQRLKPDSFCVENVEGLTRKMMDPIVNVIRACAKSIGYRTGAWVLHGTDAGSCQTRPRFILLAYSEELGMDPSMPLPIPERDVKKIKDLIPDAVRVTIGSGAKEKTVGAEGYLGTVTRDGLTVETKDGVIRSDVEDEKKIFEFPEDFIFLGSDDDIRDRIGNCVIPKFAKWIMEHVDAEIAEAKAAKNNVNDAA